MTFIKKAVAGHLSFGVFPRNAGEMTRVLSGRCGCRFVRGHRCVGTGGVRPPIRPPIRPPVRPTHKRCPRGTRKISIKKKVCSCRPVSPRPGKKGSLIFVIDDTGSMGRLINAVRRNINDIMAANTRFENYVIATYGDPYRRNVLKTRSIPQVRSFLSRVRPHGGGDCPEMALQGVRDAAAAADHNSVLFLFTDASAKDAYLRDSVASQLAAKKIRFFTVASGNLCGQSGSEYKAIASRTGGRFSQIGMGLSAKVMTFIKRAVAGKMSFGVFPRSAGEMTKVLSGRCGCRFVRIFKCSGTGLETPHGGSDSGTTTDETSTDTSTSTETSTSTGTTSETSTSTETDGGGSGSGGWETSSHVERFCVDPYNNKKYKPGQSWVSKADQMCFHFKCGTDPSSSSRPYRSDCLSAEGSCVTASSSGAEFKCKVHGSVGKCQCKKEADGSVYITRMETSTSTDSSSETSTSTEIGGGGGSGSGGWETSSHVERFCVDPYKNKKYKPGQSWVSKTDQMCFHFKCSTNPSSSRPYRSDCLSAEGSCVAASSAGAEFNCKVHGSVGKCQCKKEADGSVYITRMETSISTSESEE